MTSDLFWEIYLLAAAMSMLLGALVVWNTGEATAKIVMLIVGGGLFPYANIGVAIVLGVIAVKMGFESVDGTILWEKDKWK